MLRDRKAYSHETSNPELPLADLEQALSDELHGKKEDAGFNPPFDVVVHSLRWKLADADGISVKAALDGIVKTKTIIEDDSAYYVNSIKFTQERIPKTEDEKTYIRFYPCKTKTSAGGLD
jgi:hypothetical protein